MGDVSAEPSMEEILSSIKRIIAEEGDAPITRGRRPASRPSGDDEQPAEILELSEPAPQPALEPPVPASLDQVSATPVSEEEPTVADSIVSKQTAEATRAPLHTLSRLMTRPEPGSDGTLEGLVRDMLRPMLREWLDANLPTMVEQLVAREISKITGQPQ